MEKRISEKSPCGALPKTFLFEFGSDAEVWSISFKAFIPEQEISRMLEAVHTHLYMKCAEAIHLYLDTCRLEYSDFTSSRTWLEHDAIMKTADRLLHAADCKIIDKQIRSVDTYYGITDCQRQTAGGYCEGCYYAVSRTLSRQKYPYKYHIICQAFQYSAADNSEHATFAIRRNDSGNRLRTLDQENGQPVLSTFGCIDMLHLLANIQSVTKKQHAAELANK